MKKLFIIAVLFLTACTQRDENLYYIENKQYEAPRQVMLASKVDTMYLDVPAKHILIGRNYKGVQRIRFVTKEVFDSIQLGDTMYVYPIK